MICAAGGYLTQGLAGKRCREPRKDPFPRDAVANKSLAVYFGFRDESNLVPYNRSSQVRTSAVSQAWPSGNTPNTSDSVRLCNTL